MDSKGTIANLPNNTHRWWFMDAGLRRLNVWMFFALLSCYGAGYDGSLVNGLQTLTPWQEDFGRPTGQILGIIGFSSTLGFIFGPIIGQLLSDKWGRHIALMVGSLCVIVGGAITTIHSNNIGQQRGIFIAGRVILGMCGGIAYVAAPVMITEMAHPRQRAIISATFQAGYQFGSVVAAWLCYGTNRWDSTWAWRLGCLVQMIPFIFIIVTMWACPQSPRWLVAHGREQEALDFFIKYHANGDVNDPMALMEFEEVKVSVQRDAQNKVGWKDFVKTAANRRRTWIAFSFGIGSQWVGNGVVSYYLSSILLTVGITSTLQQALFNGCLAIFNLIVSVSAAQFVDKVGRRPIILTAAGGMTLSFAVITGCSATFAKTGDAAYGKAVIAFIFMFSFFYDIGITCLWTTYVAEIMPYHLRAKGMVFSVTIGGLAIVFNTYINPIALAAIGWKYYFTFLSIGAAFFLNIYFFYPETKQRTPEEIQAIFEPHAPIEVLGNLESGNNVSLDVDEKKSGSLTHETLDAPHLAKQ